MEILHTFIARLKNSVKWRLKQLQGKQAEMVSLRMGMHILEYVGTPLYDLLMQSASVCYVGDSVTEGNANGGHGWYEPLAGALPTQMRQWVFAQGGATSRFFLENVRKYAKLKASVYLFAFGTNDVRYRDPAVCAMDAAAFTGRVDGIVRAIRRRRKDARIVFIAPWTTRQVDPVSTKLTKEERFRMLADYGAALRGYAAANDCLFVDPTELIQRELQKGEDLLLVDHIHPNAGLGIQTYSQAVLDASSAWQG